MAFTSGNKLAKLIMGELNNNKAFQAGAMGIGDLTNQRVQSALSRLSTTGLGRSGIGGSVLNQIYGQAGKSFANLAGAESDKRSRYIEQLLGLFDLQKKEDASKVGFGDVAGGALGMLAGSILGPVGDAGGSYLGNLLTGG